MAMARRQHRPPAGHWLTCVHEAPHGLLGGVHGKRAWACVCVRVSGSLSAYRVFDTVCACVCACVCCL